MLLVLEFLTKRCDRTVQTPIILATGLKLLSQHIECFTAGTELIVDQEHIVLDTITLRALNLSIAGIDVDHPFDRGDFLEIVQDTGHQGVSLVKLSFIVLIDEGKRIILFLEGLIFSRTLSTGSKCKQHRCTQDKSFLHTLSIYLFHFFDLFILRRSSSSEELLMRSVVSCSLLLFVLLPTMRTNSPRGS